MSIQTISTHTLPPIPNTEPPYLPDPQRPVGEPDVLSSKYHLKAGSRWLVRPELKIGEGPGPSDIRGLEVREARRLLSLLPLGREIAWHRPDVECQGLLGPHPGGLRRWYRASNTFITSCARLANEYRCRPVTAMPLRLLAVIVPAVGGQGANFENRTEEVE